MQWWCVHAPVTATLLSTLFAGGGVFHWLTFVVVAIIAGTIFQLLIRFSCLVIVRVVLII